MATLVQSGSVVAGLRSPEALVIDVYPDTVTSKITDMTDVISSSLLVIRGDDTQQTWTCTTTAQTAAKLTLTHPWVAGDNDTVGEVLRVYVKLVISAGTITAEVCTISVTKP